MLKHNIVLFPKNAPFPGGDVPENPNDFTAPANVASTFNKSFPEAGTFNYVCSLHDPAMKGTVIVEPADQPPPPPPPPPPATLPPEPIALASDLATPFSTELFAIAGRRGQPEAPDPGRRRRLRAGVVL